MLQVLLLLAVCCGAAAGGAMAATEATEAAGSVAAVAATAHPVDAAALATAAAVTATASAAAKADEGKEERRTLVSSTALPLGLSVAASLDAAPLAAALRPQLDSVGTASAATAAAADVALGLPLGPSSASSSSSPEAEGMMLRFDLAVTPDGGSLVAAGAIHTATRGGSKDGTQPPQPGATYEEQRPLRALGLDPAAYFRVSVRNAAAFAGFPIASTGARATGFLRVEHVAFEGEGEGVAAATTKTATTTRPVIRGVIHVPGNDTYVLEPSASHFSAAAMRRAGLRDVLVYRHSDVVAARVAAGVPPAHTGGIHEMPEADRRRAEAAELLRPASAPSGIHSGPRPDFFAAQQQSDDVSAENAALAATTASRRQEATDTCTIALVGDSRWAGFFGAELEAVREMVDIVAGMNTIYRAASLPGFRVVSTLLHTTSGSDPYLNEVPIAPGNFLSELNDRKSTILPTEKCAIHGFSFYDYEGVVGLAYLNGLCNPGGGAGITTGRSFSNPQSLSENIIVASHELGHNAGAGHDDDTPGTIMASSGASNGDGTFSRASLVALSEFLVTTPRSCWELGGAQVTAYCGNGYVETGEECDPGDTTSHPTCFRNCTVRDPTWDCSAAGNPCCDDTTHSYIAQGTVCGPAPYALSFLTQPTCSGQEAGCTDCWASEEPHPCWARSDLTPCNQGGSACVAFCEHSANPGVCQPASVFSVESFLPAGVCCDSCPTGNCRCDGQGACGDCEPAQCGPIVCGTISDGCGTPVSCGDCPSVDPQTGAPIACVGGVCAIDPLVGFNPNSSIDTTEAQAAAEDFWESLHPAAQVFFIAMISLCGLALVVAALGGLKESRDRADGY